MLTTILIILNLIALGVIICLNYSQHVPTQTKPAIRQESPAIPQQKSVIENTQHIPKPTSPTPIPSSIITTSSLRATAEPELTLTDQLRSQRDKSNSRQKIDRCQNCSCQNKTKCQPESQPELKPRQYHMVKEACVVEGRDISIAPAEQPLLTVSEVQSALPEHNQETPDLKSKEQAIQSDKPQDFSKDNQLDEKQPKDDRQPSQPSTNPDSSTPQQPAPDSNALQTQPSNQDSAFTSLPSTEPEPTHPTRSDSQYSDFLRPTDPLYIDYSKVKIKARVKPRMPDDDACCGTGCMRCVFDIYDDNLLKWEIRRDNAVEEQIKEHQSEQPKEFESPD